MTLANIVEEAKHLLLSEQWALVELLLRELRTSDKRDRQQAADNGAASAPIAVVPTTATPITDHLFGIFSHPNVTPPTDAEVDDIIYAHLAAKHLQ